METLEGLDGMIPVQQQPEPTEATGYDFNHDVFLRGKDAIRQLAGQMPHQTWPGNKIKARTDAVAKVTAKMLRDYPYWRRAMPALYQAYGGYCAYHARYIELVEGPTTDHFVAMRTSQGPASTHHLMTAYTWSNYRLAGSYVNGVKSALSSVLDPFMIGDGWFALDFGSFKTVVGPSAPIAKVDEIQRTIDLLHLDRGPIVQCRKRAAQLYWSPPPAKPPLPFWSLELDQPFLAAELRRQGRLNPGDESL